MAVLEMRRHQVVGTKRKRARRGRRRFFIVSSLLFLVAFASLFKYNRTFNMVEVDMGLPSSSFRQMVWNPSSSLTPNVKRRERNVNSAVEENEGTNAPTSGADEMEIRSIQVLNGPNRWSIGRNNLIVMVLDIKELETYRTNEIDGFYDRLVAVIPSLDSHPGSSGEIGGFLQHVHSGISMSHVVERVALEIQTLAGMEVRFGRTRSIGERGVYVVVFAYKGAKAGRYAANASVEIARAIYTGEARYDLSKHVTKLKDIYKQEHPVPPIPSIAREAEGRGIPLSIGVHQRRQFGYGVNQKSMRNTCTSRNERGIGFQLVKNKDETKRRLKHAEVPVPDGGKVVSEKALREKISRVGYPVVIKPDGSGHGTGVTTNVTSWSEALMAFKRAVNVRPDGGPNISPSVLVEKFLTGRDYRLLVINFRLVAAAERIPAHVVGDGRLTIRELVDEVNRDPRRGKGHENVLTFVDIDKMVLRSKGFTIHTIPQIGEVVRLQQTANLSTGGTSKDVTDFVHPSTAILAEQAARVFDLDICGVDILADNINVPLTEQGGAVIEVNANPGFRMHLAPNEGKPRNVWAPVFDMLYPPGSTSRIPIIAVTGSGGATTTSLVAHILGFQGNNVGYTSTDGTYIQGRLTKSGDCAGPKSVEAVLRSPTVDLAVLECTPKGLIQGLSFRYVDVGVVTNLQSDSLLGTNGFNTMDQLANLYSLIPENVVDDGYAVLNADDDRIYNMRENVKSNVALFSIDENNPRVATHAQNGGVSAVYENGYITIRTAETKLRIIEAGNIPLMEDVKASYVIENVLSAVLAAHLHGSSVEVIESALESFFGTHTSDRRSLFQVKRCAHDD